MSFLEKYQDKSKKIIIFSTIYYKKNIFYTEAKMKSNLLNILTFIIYKLNAKFVNEFTSLISLNIKEPKIYNQIINISHTQQSTQAIKEKLDQLEKNEIQTFISENSIKPGHQPLFKKWIFKIKRDVNGAVVKFKT